MKPKIVLLIYGSGGHKTEMEKLITKLYSEEAGLEVKSVGIAENKSFIEHPMVIETFEQSPLRDKYFSFNNFMRIPRIYFNYFSCYKTIRKKYNVLSVISTGPGLAIPFSLLFKWKKAKIIFIETSSRFESESYAGKVMYRIADKFYIQNNSLEIFYPSAIYSGLLL